jgi:hypothetical protein
MRKLIDAPYADGVSGDYPKGRVRDKAGVTEGTTYKEILVGDMYQFFQKLVIDGGVVENDLPDNVTNGYQLIEALVNKINKSTMRSNTEGIINSVMNGTEKTLASFTPDATNSWDDIKATFFATFTIPSGSNAGLTIRLIVDSVVQKSFTFTIIGDGRAMPVSCCFSGLTYTAGDIVQISGQTTGANTATATIVSLVVEGVND